MDEELWRAQSFWKRYTGLDKTDDVFQKTHFEIETPVRPRHGWLRFSREAQLYSQNHLAARLGLTQQAVARFEKNETDGSICLANLQMLADALDCELVYWLRPKAKVPFSNLIWTKIWPRTLEVFRRRLTPFHSSSPTRSMMMARIATNVFQDPEFRRKMNWVRNEKMRK